MADAVKTFGATRALAGVNLRVLGGSVTALLGANGSGKSTLIRALAGYHELDEGTILGFTVRQSYFAAFFDNDLAFPSPPKPAKNADALHFAPWGGVGPGGA